MRLRLAAALVALLLWASLPAPRAVADDASTEQLRQTIRDELEASSAARPTDVRVYWKHGLNFTSQSGNLKMKIGGRIHFDAYFFNDDGDRDDFDAALGAQYTSGVTFRRARLYNAGELYKTIGWKLQVELSGGEVEFADAWVELRRLDECWGCMVPDILIGQSKECFSLEWMTSSNYITFLERGLPVQAFVAGRNSGISLFQNFLGDENARVTAGLGWYGNSTDSGDHPWSSGSNITGRITWLPWAPCDCEHRWWLVGISGSYRFDQGLGVRYRVRPDGGLGPRIIDTGDLPAREDIRLGLETAFNYDRWSVQAECIGAHPQITGEEAPILWGWYAYATYQLSGGARALRRSRAVIDKTKPCRNFDCSERGRQGQWELAVRYAMLDLEDEAVYGGSVRSLTIGANWYLNPNVRVMFNYVYAEGENLRTGAGRPAAPSGRDANLDTFAVRFSMFW